MAATIWEFWIDVGGTFTDCLAKAPDGSIQRHKLLSSGVTKGRVAPGSTADVIVDPARRTDPANFWSGWQLSIVDPNGRELDRAKVASFVATSGQLHVSGLSAPPLVGAAYELRCELDAPLVGIRFLLGLSLAKPVPLIVLRLGTTQGTNALITRRGARTALITTR